MGLTKRIPTYKIQTVFSDNRPDRWQESFVGHDATCMNAARLLAEPGVEYVLVLRPWCRPGIMASKRDILADFQREPVAGAREMEVRA